MTNAYHFNRSSFFAAASSSWYHPNLGGYYGAGASGGGSAGYNRGVATDYRLKKHHPAKKLHNQMKPKKTSAKPAKPKS